VLIEETGRDLQPWSIPAAFDAEVIQIVEVLWHYYHVGETGTGRRRRHSTQGFEAFIESSGEDRCKRPGRYGNTDSATWTWIKSDFTPIGVANLF
jgi:hypothetical protein